jgi:small subunit ribosomal protein S4
MPAAQAPSRLIPVRVDFKELPFMARYTGPMTKKSRRLGVDLVGGDQAYERRPYPPGQHGRGRIKETEYLLQLREKQKARFTYGVLEKQFRRYYQEASRRPGKTGDNLLRLLEGRLDNVVYRAGFARTRRHARQLVAHGHFQVNGRKVNIPSFQVSEHDVIDVRAKSAEMTPFIVARETHGDRLVPAWLEVLPTRMRILVHQLPVRQQIDVPVQEQLIVEYYSKK